VIGPRLEDDELIRSHSASSPPPATTERNSRTERPQIQFRKANRLMSAHPPLAQRATNGMQRPGGIPGEAAADHRNGSYGEDDGTATHLASHRPDP